MLQRVVFPAIGKLLVRQITPAHILNILSKAVKSCTTTVAAEAKRIMSGIFELAVATLQADSDPVWPVRKVLSANKTQHKTLGSEQIGKLLSDFDNHRCGYQVNFRIQLMWWALTCPSEAAEVERVAASVFFTLCAPTIRRTQQTLHPGFVRAAPTQFMPQHASAFALMETTCAGHCKANPADCQPSAGKEIGDR